MDAVTEGTFARDLARVQAARIYFNHMSIGGNMLDGVTTLARGHGTISLDEIEVGKVSKLPPSYFAHSSAGTNGQPMTKIEAFRTALEKSFESAPDLALMKLCYVDIWGDTDVDEIFERYRATVETLRSSRPETTIVHVTVPLQVKETGFKQSIKKLTGIKDTTANANMRRHAFNEKIRQTFADQPIFDLARLESTWPDGRSETFERNGQSYPSLVPAYASDGAHLNEFGQTRLGRAFIHALASILEEQSASTRSHR